MAALLDERSPGFADAFAALVDRRREETADVREAVRAILAEVRRDGDAALVRLTARFDRLELAPDELRVGKEAIAAARRCLRPRVP